MILSTKSPDVAPVETESAPPAPETGARTVILDAARRSRLAVLRVAPRRRSIRVGHPLRQRTRGSKDSGPFPHAATNGGGRGRSNTVRERNRKGVGYDSFACDGGGRWMCTPSTNRLQVTLGGPKRGVAGIAQILTIPLLSSLAAVREKHSALGSPGSGATMSPAGLNEPLASISPYHRHDATCGERGDPRSSRLVHEVLPAPERAAPPSAPRSGSRTLRPYQVSSVYR